MPVAEFKPDRGAASVFNSSINLIDLSQNAVTWNWSFGDGAIAVEQNPRHYYDEIGKFKNCVDCNKYSRLCKQDGTGSF